MTQLDRFRETIATYRSHGWQLHRVLMRAETQAHLVQPGLSQESAPSTFDGAPVQLAEYDAVWFTRASGAPNRAAWELRLIGDAPYALFEVFEPDEAEEDRADVRREMEARLREYVGGRGEAAPD